MKESQTQYWRQKIEDALAHGQQAKDQPWYSDFVKWSCSEEAWRVMQLAGQPNDEELMRQVHNGEHRRLLPFEATRKGDVFHFQAGYCNVNRCHIGFRLEAWPNGVKKPIIIWRRISWVRRFIAKLGRGLK